MNIKKYKKILQNHGSDGIVGNGANAHFGTTTGANTSVFNIEIRDLAEEFLDLHDYNQVFESTSHLRNQ